LTVTPNAVSTTYSGVPLANTAYSDNVNNYNISGYVNGETAASASIQLSGSVAFNGATTTTVLNIGAYTQGAGNLAMTAANGNYVMQFANPAPNNYVITPAILTYVATPFLRLAGEPNLSVTGTVAGFLANDTLASATTGTLLWTTTANASSAPGQYAIIGSGLSAANYIFVQAPGNATAIMVLPRPSYTPPNSNPTTPGNTTTFNFQNSNPGNSPIHVSFTPNGSKTVDNGNNDANPASLPAGDALTQNNGFSYPPISQYDVNQYSDFTLPPYANDDSEAAIFTILARGASPGHGSDYMIDGFWMGGTGVWPADNSPLVGKITFSNGDGQDVTPGDGNAFPIVPGPSDFAALLKNGPVMIGGSPNQTPAQWLLATGMTPDGKGIICDDPASGGVVELAYDPTTNTVGGLTGIFNAPTNSFVPLAEAGNNIPTNDASGLAGLQGFVPSTYYAVTVH
jgi:hypothetical protein